jgi:integrase
LRTENLSAIIELYCTVTGVTSGTKRLHLIWLTHFERFLDREPVVADLTDLTYARYVQWRSPKVSSETVRGECNKILAVWRWCSGGNRRWIDGPEVKAPQPQYRLPKALDREQLERLWAVAKVYPRLIGSLPGNVVLSALLYVLWDTSERIGAVHQIDRDNVDLKRGFIIVEPESRKGGTQGRIYKVRPATVEAIAKLLAIYRGQHPFAECSVNNYYQHWYMVRTEAALPRWVTFHTLRKSHASHLVAMGGDARLSLGHSSDTITNRHYVDQRIASEGQQPCDLLFDPGQASGKSWWKRMMG